MDFVNAIILLLNYIFVPALAYGSQLALGAIFVTLIYGILRFANFATGDMMSFGTMFVILFTWYFQSVGISLGAKDEGMPGPRHGKDYYAYLRDLDGNKICIFKKI